MLKVLVEDSKILNAWSEYKELAVGLVDWRDNLESNDENLLFENSGNYQDEFHRKSITFTEGKLSELDTKVTTTVEVLEGAHTMVKGLIARCSDFGSILRGESALGKEEYEISGTGGVDILLFEDKHCSEDSGYTGEILEETDNIVNLCNAEKEDISEITSALSHLRTINVNVSGQLSAIEDSIEKQGRVVPLYASLVEYGIGVSNLNLYVASALSPHFAQNNGKALSHYRNSSRSSYATNNNVIIRTAMLKPGDFRFYTVPHLYQPWDYETIVKIAVKIGVTVEEAKEFLEGYIPQNWTNDQMIAFLDALSHGRAVPAYVSYFHMLHNKQELADVYVQGQYIENQNDWDNIYYGINPPGDAGTMAYSGCELIAVVNAMHSMGYDMSEEEVAELIDTFETDGAVLDGMWGSSPVAIANYMENHGYSVTVSSTNDYSEIEKIAENSDTVIVTVYNDANDITAQIHTVNIEKVEHSDGSYGYVVHNVALYNEQNNVPGYQEGEDEFVSSKEYSSVEDAIKYMGGSNPDSAIIQTIGISEPIMGDFPIGDSEVVAC